MGPKASNNKHRNLHHFSSVLSSAFLEWALIILLFLNGFFSYLVTKFACVNKLKPPCLLCSRLDHVIGREEPALHRDLLCDLHKLEISNWAFCHVHGQLANLCSMCEKCLFSFFSDEKLNNTCMYLSFLGNVGTEINHADASQVPLLKEDNETLLLTEVTKVCSCCNEPVKQNKVQVFRLLHDLRNRDRDEIESIDRAKIGTNQKVILEKDTDQLTHVEYNELKTSDSDSESPVNDTLVSSRKIQVNNTANFVTFSDHRDSSNEKPLMDPNVLDELNQTESHCTESDEKKNDISNELSREDSVNLKGSIEKEIPTIAEDKITSLDGPPILSRIQSPYPNPKPNSPHIPPDPIPSRSGSISLSDAYNLAIGNKLSPSISSPKFEDVIMGKDSSRVYDELKLLISQISAARGVDCPWNDIGSSPRLQQGDENVLNNITKTLSLERNESLSRVESLEGSIVSEIEGESPIDRLKRQVELDRKSISLLYKELEEERSASAIAANQAMAMITRLQEEKAAMQMEALQYQRMMEEQAEYDQEALQKCNEIISQKEKTIQELDVELASYRDRVVHNWSELSLLGFEEQKAYISDRLSELEEKLHLFSNNSSFVETTKLDCIEEVEEEEEESTSKKENYRRQNGETLKYVPVRKSGLVRSEESPKDLVDLGDEISRLCERLKALEADHNFLEHSLNSIKNGQEGVRFIHDIALSLQDLRSLGITHGNKVA